MRRDLDLALAQQIRNSTIILKLLKDIDQDEFTAKTASKTQKGIQFQHEVCRKNTIILNIFRSIKTFISLNIQTELN